MNQLQPFKKKRKCCMDEDRFWKQAQKSIIVKDLSIQNLRCNLDYLTELDEPVLCKGTPVNGDRSSADVLGKVVFKVLMSYSEVSQLGSISHPLQNIILKPGNYLEGPKPGIIKKMSEYYMPPNDFGIYNIYIPEEKTHEDINTMKMINWLWVNQRHNYDAWMNIISAMVFAKCPIKNNFIKKCFLTRVSVNALIGPRGICHGLCDLKVPNLKINQSTGVYSWPKEWALHFDDNSSYHSNSPVNSDFDTDSVDSGPIGVARNRPRITGFTSFTETSSESSSENSSKVKTSRLDLFIDGHSGDYWDRRMRKRFDLYVQTSFNERRNRGVIREARRKVRLQYDSKRRTMEPAFNAEAKRAEALAAERVRVDIRDRNQEVEQISDIPCRSREKPIEHYLYRYKQLNHKLKSQLECSWTRYYGEKLIPKYLNNSEHLNDVSLKCWLSPVPWIEQTGTNDEFAAIVMALQRTKLIDVILGETEKKNSYEPRKLLKQLPNGATYFEKKKNKFHILGCNNSSEFNRAIMSTIEYHMRGFDRILNRSEFKTENFALAAHIGNAIENLSEIHFVKSDLLANYKNDLRPDASEAEQSIRDSSLSIVQRLVRGQLIAVYYDADDKKRPTCTGGRTTDWALLCGVIVGFPSKQPSEKPLLADKIKIPYKDKQLAYVYHYEPNIHSLTPKGFISRKTGKPVDIATIKKQAVHLTEEPNDNGDMHGQNCNKASQKCQKCMIEYVDKELDLERDADRVWVVARHRNEYVVWTLRELAKSNRQLRIPGREVMDNIPRQQRLDMLLRQPITGQELPPDSFKLSLITYRQRIREQLNAKRRKNRALCTEVANQMKYLSLTHPDLLPSELVELLDLSRHTTDSVDVWKSAARVAYETLVNVPCMEPIRPKMPTTKPLNMSEEPPEIPIPTFPTPPTYRDIPSTSCPNIFHHGFNIDTDLAQQYVCFEPKEELYKNNSMDAIPNVNDLNDTVIKPVQFYFSMNGKMNSEKATVSGSRGRRYNRASTSATFAG